MVPQTNLYQAYPQAITVQTILMCFTSRRNSPCPGAILPVNAFHTLACSYLSVCTWTRLCASDAGSGSQGKGNCAISQRDLSGGERKRGLIFVMTTRKASFFPVELHLHVPAVRELANGVWLNIW